MERERAAMIPVSRSPYITQFMEHQLAKQPRTPRLTSSDVILATFASDESAAMTNWMN